jgi:ABC-2 type transport system permease protein
MLRGLWKLTWLEIKIFLREPLGAFGSIFFPILVLVVVSRFDVLINESFASGCPLL